MSLFGRASPKPQTSNPYTPSFFQLVRECSRKVFAEEDFPENTSFQTSDPCHCSMGNNAKVDLGTVTRSRLSGPKRSTQNTSLQSSDPITLRSKPRSRFGRGSPPQWVPLARREGETSIVSGRLPQNQRHNVVLTLLDVPYSVDSGFGKGVGPYRDVQ